MNLYPWLEDYLMAKPGAEQDFKLEWQWQRYMVRGKLFAAVCTPGPEHRPHAGRTMVILKCDPRLAEAFRAEFAKELDGITLSGYERIVFQASALEELDSYDGVLFLEKQGTSYSKMIKKERALAANRDVKVFGAVVL